MHLIENKETLKYSFYREIKRLIDALFPPARRQKNWRLAIAAVVGKHSLPWSAVLI